jgi:hypothetical protein
MRWATRCAGWQVTFVPSESRSSSAAAPVLHQIGGPIRSLTNRRCFSVSRRSQRRPPGRLGGFRGVLRPNLQVKRKTQALAYLFDHGPDAPDLHGLPHVLPHQHRGNKVLGAPRSGRRSACTRRTVGGGLPRGNFSMHHQHKPGLFRHGFQHGMIVASMSPAANRAVEIAKSALEAGVHPPTSRSAAAGNDELLRSAGTSTLSPLSDHGLNKNPFYLLAKLPKTQLPSPSGSANRWSCRLVKQESCQSVQGVPRLVLDFRRKRSEAAKDGSSND